MIKKQSRSDVRVKKHMKVRNRLSGTAERPRLAVFRSNNHKDVKDGLEKTNNVDAAAKLGEIIAKKALDKGINTVVFDRGGFVYQGKVKALAEAAREAGLNF